MKKMTLIIDIGFLGDIILSTLYILKTKSNFTVFLLWFCHVAAQMMTLHFNLFKQNDFYFTLWNIYTQNVMN